LPASRLRRPLVGGDAGTNAIFAACMKKNQPSVPSLPPAQACPVTVAPGAR
jgi:hypothetical protein